MGDHRAPQKCQRLQKQVCYKIRAISIIVGNTGNHRSGFDRLQNLLKNNGGIHISACLKSSKFVMGVLQVKFSQIYTVGLP